MAAAVWIYYWIWKLLKKTHTQKRAWYVIYILSNPQTTEEEIKHDSIPFVFNTSLEFKAILMSSVSREEEWVTEKEPISR